MADVQYVNEQDEVIGRTSVHDAMVRHQIVRITRVFVFDETGRLYLQRRSFEMENAPGLWDQSAAGHVDIGETYDQAAARELEEELGLKKLTLNQKVYYYGEEPHPKYGKLRRFNALYTADYDGQEISLDPEEVAEGKWVSIPYLEQWMIDKPKEFSAGFTDAYQKYKEAS